MLDNKRVLLLLDILVFIGAVVVISGCDYALTEKRLFFLIRSERLFKEVLLPS